MQSLRLLLFPQRTYPSDHAMLETVYARLLPAQGHEVHWVMRRGPGAPAGDIADWKASTAHLIRESGPRRGSAVCRALARLREARRLAVQLCRQRRFDIVQVRNEISGALVALDIRRVWGTPFVYQFSFPVAESALWIPDGEGMRRSFGSRVRASTGMTLQHWVMHKADLVLAISDAMREELIAAGLPGEKVRTFPLGFDADIRPDQYDGSAVRREYALNDRPVVVFFGAMDRLRRLDFLLRVFARVLTMVPRAVLLMVGRAEQGADLIWLRTEAERLGVAAAVRFVDVVPRTEVPRFLAAAQVAVAPYPPTPIDISRSPTKVLESLGMATPVVANAEVRDQRQILEASGGGLCVPYDVERFAHALTYLLTHPDEAAAAGRRGREYVLAHRSYGKLASEVVGYYQSLLSAR